ncbi:TPA: hypothetical protein EYP66_23090 [Candidatus Poribacteria bacterium]|nr:hypothetical protein [Candidatus Poribacteria bacterium]
MKHLFFGGVRNSSEAYCFLALATLRSANRRICGSLTLRSNLLSQTSHIPRTLGDISLGELKT